MNVTAEEGGVVATLKLSRSQMISSTDMGRRFAEYLDRARRGLERLFVTRNNEIEAVLIGIEDYERLLELEELVESLAIDKLVKSRRGEPEVGDLEALLREEGLTEDDLRGIDPD